MYIPKWIVFGTAGILVILLVIILLLSLNTASSKNKDDINPVSPASQQIISSEMTADCQVKLQITDSGEKYIPTHYTDQTRCQAFTINKVSLSGEFVVFQDVSEEVGGISNEIHLYSTRTDAVTVLDSLGASKIYDIEFLSDDQILSLHRYADTESEDEAFITLYYLKNGDLVRYPLPYFPEEEYTSIALYNGYVWVSGEAIPPHIVRFAITPGGLEQVP